MDRTSPDYIQDARPLVQIICLNGQPHIFAARIHNALLVPVKTNRKFGPPLTFNCTNPMAVATGDINANGQIDLVFACRQPEGETECSWIYWGHKRKFFENRRTPLFTYRAYDVALGDLDGNGFDDIVICQSHTRNLCTRDSLLFRGGLERDENPIGLTTHDGRRVFLAQPEGSGLSDVIFINTQGRQKVENVPIYIYSGGKNGFSVEHRRDLPGWGTIGALCCDLDDDGHTDIVLVNSSHNSPSRDPGSFIYLGGNNGFTSKPSWILPTDLAHGACCADIDRDGYLELIFCGHLSSEILIFHNGPKGIDTENPERICMDWDSEQFSSPLWIYLADLDNDGWLDLVVPQSRSDRSLILWGGPNGFRKENSQFLSIWKGICARSADLTGNGYLDLIMGSGPPLPG